ncbi:uncharacterized protein LOC111698347 [Eurytemora carolleeae]|uniref:uncharacterized protein LOC111698347 n=1 Tax=Eurytemora carolleeae TaxID=1294199 RepID=UPI000C75FEC4|nr:uncharacterized protein LOC111698347 [Eurytemora carolleeae]|eukprot:XP_023324429.1 uncharacterized protein LOC111698347 [Eurytemora affinis]
MVQGIDLSCDFNGFQASAFPNLWNACELYTHLPYGYSTQPDTESEIQARNGGSLNFQLPDPLYWNDEYYDEYDLKNEDEDETVDDQTFQESSILDNIRTIISPVSWPARGSPLDTMKRMTFELPEWPARGSPLRNMNKVMNRIQTQQWPAKGSLLDRIATRIKSNGSPQQVNNRIFPINNQPQSFPSTPPSRRPSILHPSQPHTAEPPTPSSNQFQNQFPAFQPLSEEFIDKQDTLDSRSPLVQGGFFGLALPLILGILFTLGIPLVQIMFASASIITAFMIQGRGLEGLNAASFDAALRYILISAMNILQGFSREARTVELLHSLPFCVNSSLLYSRLEENECKGDFLEYILPKGSGILSETQVSDQFKMADNGSMMAESRLIPLVLPESFGCREGSIPDIVAKIGRLLSLTLGDCSENTN